MRALAWFLIFFSLSSGAQTLVVLGEISDSQCAFNVHSNGSSHDDAFKSNILGELRKTARAVAFVWAVSSS